MYHTCFAMIQSRLRFVDLVPPPLGLDGAGLRRTGDFKAATSPPVSPFFLFPRPVGRGKRKKGEHRLAAGM